MIKGRSSEQNKETTLELLGTKTQFRIRPNNFIQVRFQILKSFSDTSFRNKINHKRKLESKGFLERVQSRWVYKVELLLISN